MGAASERRIPLVITLRDGREQVMPGCNRAGELLKSRCACGLRPPWLAANAQAHAANQDQFEIVLEGERLRQAPQRYATKAYQELRRKRAALSEDATLAGLLARWDMEALLYLPPREPREAPAAAVETEAEPLSEMAVASAEAPVESELLSPEADA